MTASTPSPSNAAVSVVIPCFNTDPIWLRELLESLRLQTLEPSEIIVVDDGSTEAKTLALLESLLSPQQILRQPNQGPGPSRNAGVQRASGEFVLLIDADDQLRSDALAKLVALLRTQPDAAFAYSQIEAFGARSELHRVPPFNGYLELGENFAVSCALFRRSAIVEHHLQWPAMRGYEDWAFWVSCAEKGLRGAVSEEPLFRYRAKRDVGVNAGADRKRAELRAEIARLHPKAYATEGRARLKQRWAPGLEIISLLPPDQERRLLTALEKQSFDDLIVTPIATLAPPRDARALLASIRGKYFMLAGPAELKLLEGPSTALLEQSLRLVETVEGRAPHNQGFALLRSWELARHGEAAAPPGLAIEELVAHALRSIPRKGLSARARSAARGLIARTIGEERAAAILHPWKKRFAREPAISCSLIPASRLTELQLLDALPIRFERAPARTSGDPTL